MYDLPLGLVISLTVGIILLEGSHFFEGNFRVSHFPHVPTSYRSIGFPSKRNHFQITDIWVFVVKVGDSNAFDESCV